MAAKPSILILHASGTNRDEEAARACLLAGGQPEIVHLNRLRAGERPFQSYDMLLLPGGFSYGDALGAGARLALDMQVFFHDQLHTFVDSGKPVLGICNGFQALVKAGLLPGANDSDAAVQTSRVDMSARRVTLTENDCGHFECRWIYLSVETETPATYLSGISDLIFCPVAHGEGNFQVIDQETLADLEARKLIALRYVNESGAAAAGRYPQNPNGSAADIAGICNERGNVLGLMPHPEDHIMAMQNPLGRRGQFGLTLFEAMIASA
jgi:phosphoribosylformylglycinamidine synthase